MAYTYTWNEATPAGSSNANTIDTIVQDVKKSIRERMDGLLVTSWAADPIVLLPAVTGAVVGLEYNIPAIDFIGITGSPSFSLTGGYVTGGDFYFAPVKLPVGVVITDIKVFTRNNSGSTASAYLQHTTTVDTAAASTATTDTGSTLSIASNANGLFNLYTQAGLAISINTGWYYMVYDAGQTTDRLRGVTLIYDSTSHMIRR